MKYETAKITYYGAELEFAKFIIPNLPDDKKFKLEWWPTFCGAGSGIGDWFVPDETCGVPLPPLCFQHDIDFAISDDTWQAFFAANLRLYLNARNLVYAHADRKKYGNFRIEMGCLKYFIGVMVFGHNHFKKSQDDNVVVTDPLKHPVVIQKLDRLNKVVAACKS